MLDAIARVKGDVPFALNLHLPDMLVAKVLRSPFPHARIVKLDSQAAEQFPGVVAILTGADLGQPGGPGVLYGQVFADHPVVAHERVRFVGEPVALVAAESEAAAQAALAAIEVEYEELPAVYDALEAMTPAAPTLHDAYPDNCFKHAPLRHGDLEAGFAAAAEIIEETYTSPVAHYAALEPHTTAAQWGEDGLTIWSSTQSPYTVRGVVSTLFGLAPDAVRVIVSPLGGGYGGKGHMQIEPMVAALAWKVGGRPVKLTLSRAEEFVTTTKHACTITIKSGVKRDGTVTARQITAYWNAGAYADVSPMLVFQGMLRSIGPYKAGAVSVDSYGVYTNLPSAAAFRGAMSSQGTWAYESHTDTIAHHLGLDPTIYRLETLLEDGDRFATGETLHDVHFTDCLRACVERLEAAPKSFPTSGPLRRGRGVAVMMKNALPNSRSECRLRLDDRGQLTLFTSTVEMGQGTHTSLAQIAAEGLAQPLAQTTVVGPDTAKTPFDTTTAAARSITMMGGATIDGASKLKEKLLEAAMPLLEHPVEELSLAEGHVIVTAQPTERMAYAEVLRRNQLGVLEAVGEYSTNEGSLDPKTGQGLSTPHWHQGAGACEVEVDTETGQVRLLRHYGSSFAGRIINPTMVKLQNDGSVIFGLGPTILEEMIFDGGQVINGTLADYNIPSFLDIPPELACVSLESTLGEIHGVGEMTLPPVSPAVANAIYDAVGIRLRDLPITPEKVLSALKAEEAS